MIKQYLRTLAFAVGLLIPASFAFADGPSAPPAMSGLTGRGTAGPGTGIQNFELTASGATPGTYGDATHCVTGLTVDDDGTISAVGQSTSCPGATSTAVIFVGVATNSTNAFTIASPTPTGFTFTNQYLVWAKMPATNTGAATLNVNSVGAKDINKQGPNGLAALAGGELVSGNEYAFVANTTCDCYVMTTLLSSANAIVGTNRTVTAAEFANWSYYNVNASSVTITLPLSSLLASNGGLLVYANGNAVTLAPNAADAINGGSTGASVTIASGQQATVTTNGAGAITAAQITASGSGTVTSVALASANNVACVVSGSPVTTSGTLTCTPAGTSGGVPYFNSASTLASSAALTANLPVIGGGAGAAPAVGTRTGNTTAFVTQSGAATSARCAHYDASGNLAAASADCSAGGGGTFAYSANGVTVTAGTYYVPIGGGGIPTATEANVSVKAPSATTITNLQVSISADPGSGQTLAVTLRLGGSDQTVTCTITGSGGGTATTCQDLAHSVSVAQNDIIDWKIVTTGTYVATPTITITANNGTSNVGITTITAGTNITLSSGATCTTTCTINSTASGGWSRGSNCSTLATTATTKYCTVTGQNSAQNSANSVYMKAGAAATVTAIQCEVTAAPGAGTQHVFALYVNGSASALTCTIADAATTGTGSGSISVAATDIIAIRDTTTGSPASATAFLGLGS